MSPVKKLCCVHKKYFKVLKHAKYIQRTLQIVETVRVKKTDRTILAEIQVLQVNKTCDGGWYRDQVVVRHSQLS